MEIPDLFDTVNQYLNLFSSNDISVESNRVDGQWTYLLNDRVHDIKELVTPFDDKKNVVHSTTACDLGSTRPDIRTLKYTEMRLSEPNIDPKRIQQRLKNQHDGDMEKYLRERLPVTENDENRGVVLWCDGAKDVKNLPNDMEWFVSDIPSTFDEIQELSLFSYNIVVMAYCDDPETSARIARWLLKPGGQALIVGQNNLDPELLSKTHFRYMEQIGHDTILST